MRFTELGRILFLHSNAHLLMGMPQPLRPARGVIFDFDATLSDHPSTLGRTFVEELGEWGIEITLDRGKQIARDMQQRVSGRESTIVYLKTLSQLLKDLGFRGVLKRLNIVRKFARRFHRLCTETQLFPNIPEVLDALSERGKKLAIVTSSNARELARASTQFRDVISKHFKVIISRDDVEEVKPNPKCVLLAAERLALAPEECYLVGDSWQDILAGKQANMVTIGVLWGYGTREVIEEHEPNLIASTPLELKELIK